MINPKCFTKALLDHSLGPVVEVPCSYFKDFLNYLWDSRAIDIVNPTNEALVMGIASGYYLSTGKIPIVAIQNSGLMNTLNALTSLNNIYKIPAFFLLTWRGEGGPGHDAPEHDMSGGDLEQILKAFKMPFEIINETNYAEQIKRLKLVAESTLKPVALIIKNHTFEPYKRVSKIKEKEYEMDRYDTISLVKKIAKDRALFLSATGFPTRDSFAANDTPDFYMVGSMGHIFALALGISPQTNKKIIVFDGDGGSLMHLGGLASFDPKMYKNIIYIVLDNQMYESTGGQPTVASNVDFMSIAKTFRFKHAYQIKKSNQLLTSIKKAIKTPNSSFFHVYIKENKKKVGKRISDVYSCPEIKGRFMKQIVKINESKDI